MATCKDKTIRPIALTIVVVAMFIASLALPAYPGLTNALQENKTLIHPQVT